MRVETKLTLPGGTLAFFCTHTYAHTRRETESLLPYSLKGLDSTLFSVFCSLGLPTTVRPVMGDEAWDEYQQHQMENWEGQGEGEGEWEEMVAREEAMPAVSRVGKAFGKIKMLDLQMQIYEDPTPVLNRYFPLQEFEDVIWLNEARHEGWEFQVVNLKYGNEASLMWDYSHAAILVDVPRWEDRVLKEGEEGMVRFGDFRRDGGDEGKGKDRA
jgi:hypothetical protein